MATLAGQGAEVRERSQTSVQHVAACRSGQGGVQNEKAAFAEKRARGRVSVLLLSVALILWGSAALFLAP